MTIGEKLLNLTVEYRESVDNRVLAEGLGAPVGREPREIAADYEAAVLELVSQRV